jgi:hypothetical protein
MTDEVGETVALGEADPLSEGGEAVIAASFVVVGSRSPVDLLGESEGDQLLQRPVEGCGTHLDQAPARLLDGLHDGVAVRFARRESNEDMKPGGCEWQKRAGF